MYLSTPRATHRHTTASHTSASGLRQGEDPWEAPPLAGRRRGGAPEAVLVHVRLAAARGLQRRPAGRAVPPAGRLQRAQARARRQPKEVPHDEEAGERVEAAAGRRLRRAQRAGRPAAVGARVDEPARQRRALPRAPARVGGVGRRTACSPARAPLPPCKTRCRAVAAHHCRERHHNTPACKRSPHGVLTFRADLWGRGEPRCAAPADQAHARRVRRQLPGVRRRARIYARVAGVQARVR